MYKTGNVNIDFKILHNLKNYFIALQLGPCQKPPMPEAIYMVSMKDEVAINSGKFKKQILNINACICTYIETNKKDYEFTDMEV